jgi:hypothetical protein
MLGALAVVKFSGPPASFDDNPGIARIAVGTADALRALTIPVELALPFDAETTDG